VSPRAKNGATPVTVPPTAPLGTPTPGSMAGLSGAIRRSRPAVPLDEVDLHLLRLLADDARQSGRQLAREVGMSAPAVTERVNRLERLGVITGYRVSVDWDAVGLPMLVFIPMLIAPGADVSTLVEELLQIRELEDLVTLTGNYDLMARLRLRDHQHLQEVLLDRLWPIRGLQRVETFLSLGELVQTDDLLARMLARDEIADAQDQEETS
jgi:Lrp/AsnC family transcriptional regulator, leucine-responsive regulatory protein